MALRAARSSHQVGRLIARAIVRLDGWWPTRESDGQDPAYRATLLLFLNSESKVLHPTRNSVKKTNATMIKVSAVPWPEITRRIIPIVTVQKTIINPLVLVLAGRCVKTRSNQPDTNPMTKGQVVEEIPPRESLCLWASRPIATNRRMKMKSVTNARVFMTQAYLFKVRASRSPYA